MLSKPKHCSQCGIALEPQRAGSGPAAACPSCHAPIAVFGPPTAAAVLLNDRREVLLVKCRRASGRAAWCLPMDHACSGESLADAAGRALREQAGVDGDVIRLVDAQSTTSEEGGDMLTVTFEMRKVGGTEGPGPDAESVAYFPLSRYPELALPANARALRICAESHLEEWAIRDSFDHLQSDDVKAMLSDFLVALVKDHAADIARAWLAEVRQSPTTTSYRHIDADKLRQQVVTVLQQLGRWLAGDEGDREIAEFYVTVGRERNAQGFENHEVLSALMLLKKHLWSFARDHGTWERPIDLYRALELSRRIAVFFDKAVYHVTRGFETANVPQPD